MQFKWTYNSDEHDRFDRKLVRYMKGLNGLFRVAVKKGGSLEKLDEMDKYKMYSIAAAKNDLHQKKIDVHHDNKWKTDCRWCCNTPWV